MSAQNQYPPTIFQKWQMALCRRPLLAWGLPLLLAGFILVVDLLLPAPVEFAAFLLAPLLLATYCRGWQYGVALGWLLAAAEQILRQLDTAVSATGAATDAAANVLIWGAAATLLVLITASAWKTQQAREQSIRLRTLQQTLVTVNDIVRNRLGVLLGVCDVLEEGRMPSARQVASAHTVLQEIVQMLDQLGRLKVVAVQEVAKGVEAVSIDPD